ncbi:MAG: hypothetical protein PHX09_01985 [Clostridia bacterium]|nr:hypothetical protein [Clostridia bacterium]MDD4685956.1 hypothetical protein [Clostridia bacterium]
MITLILPLTTKQVCLTEIVKQIKNISDFNISLLILCEKKHSITVEFEKYNKSKSKNLNIGLNIFPNGTSEDSMINICLKELPNSNFILVRNDVKDFNTALIKEILLKSNASKSGKSTGKDNNDRITGERSRGGDVVMAKPLKKPNPIKNFFSRIAKKMCGLLFHFSFYDGDIGVQYFSDFTHSIMKTTNPLILTKLNKWLAINIEYVEFDVENTRIKNKDYSNNKLLMFLYAVSLFLVIGVAIFLVPIISSSFLIWLVVAFLCLILTTLILATTFRIYLIYKLGNIHSKNAYIINRR